jgi:hypothetical protein
MDISLFKVPPQLLPLFHDLVKRHDLLDIQLAEIEQTEMEFGKSFSNLKPEFVWLAVKIRLTLFLETRKYRREIEKLMGKILEKETERVTDIFAP